MTGKRDGEGVVWIGKMPNEHLNHASSFMWKQVFSKSCTSTKFHLVCTSEYSIMVIAYNTSKSNTGYIVDWKLILTFVLLTAVTEVFFGLLVSGDSHFCLFLALNDHVVVESGKLIMCKMSDC